MGGLQMGGLQMMRITDGGFTDDGILIFRLEIKGCCYKELLKRGKNYLFKK
jgi:hypothetical protein